MVPCKPLNYGPRFKVVLSSIFAVKCEWNITFAFHVTKIRAKLSIQPNPYPNQIGLRPHSPVCAYLEKEREMFVVYATITSFSKKNLVHSEVLTLKQNSIFLLCSSSSLIQVQLPIHTQRWENWCVPFIFVCVEREGGGGGVIYIYIYGERIRDFFSFTITCFAPLESNGSSIFHSKCVSISSLLYKITPQKSLLCACVDLCFQLRKHVFPFEL